MRNRFRIDFRSVFEIALILFSLYISVSPLFKFGYFKYSLIILFIAAIIYFILYVRKISKVNIIVLSALTAFLLVTAMVSGFGNFDAYVSIMIQILIAMIIASGVERKRFKKVFVALIVVFAFLSLIFFGLQLVFPNIAEVFPSFRFLEGRTYTNQFLYNYIIFDSGADFLRNPGICWEPGCFQGFLNLAIIFILQKKESLKLRDGVELGILILALITTKSTAGYALFALIVLLIALPRAVRYLKNNLKKLYYIVPTAVFLLIGAVVFVVNNDSFTEIFTKPSMMYEGGSYFIDRLSLNKISDFFGRPLLNILFGSGAFVSESVSGVWNSILYDMFHVGIFPVFILLYGYWRYAKSNGGVFALVIVISFLLIFSTESLFHTVIFLIFCCQGFGLIKKQQDFKKIKLKEKTEGSTKKKKVLWTTNVIMPYPAKQIGRGSSVFGGWLIGLMKQIVKNEKYRLAIAAIYNGEELKMFDDGKVIYYLLPCNDDTRYDDDLEEYWHKIVEDFQPDLIHLHGTEFAHNLALQNACPNKKYLVSLQGLMGPISEKYLAGISKKEYRMNMTPRDFLRGSALREQKNFCRRAGYEKIILKNANAIVGRTMWDRVNSLKIAGEKPYFKCNEILRDAFYGQDWNVRQIEPHSIYVSQASYPLKGFHILLDALPKLIEKYPDLKVYVAGTNILDRSTLRKRLLYPGYAKILDKKIKKHHLKNNIRFIGEKPEDGVLEYMKKSNAFVQCSVVENSPNSLGEAMLIGMPCVVSNVGGTADLLDMARGEGLLYRFGDTKTLIESISRVFDDSEFATGLGKNAKKHAKIIYNKQRNADTMLEIYEKVINDED